LLASLLMKKQFANRPLAMLAFLVGTSALTAFAQPPGRPDPADPAAPVPGVKNPSAFSDYQPYQEPKLRSWKEALEELAARAPAEGHAGMHGKEKQAGQGASAGAGHEGHAKPKAVAPRAKGGVSKGHEHMAMAKPQAPASAAKRGTARTDLVSGTGVIREIDKANRRVKITHDPIDALGWPGLTLFIRLKDGALADAIRANEKVRFTLEKSASGYVIADFQKPTGKNATPQGHHK
jgi:Cu(I)/Ag(I) efflux system protein CusF